MTKFICLTEVCTSTEPKKILLNTDYIVHMQMGHKGEDVHIRMNDKTFYFVRESIEDIKQLIAGVPIKSNGNMFDRLAAGSRSEANLKSLGSDSVNLARADFQL